MGPILANILKYLKLIVRIGPILYEGVKWGKRIYNELKKKEPVKTLDRGATYTRKSMERLMSIKPRKSKSS